MSENKKEPLFVLHTSVSLVVTIIVPGTVQVLLFVE